MSGIVRFTIACAAVGLLPAVLAAQVSQSREERRFDAQRGDTLVILNDYGRIRVESRSSSQEVKVTIRKIVPSKDRLENVVVLAQKSGNKIFLNTYYYDYQAESVYLDVEVPPFLNVVIWGANPAVEISGVEGYVRGFTQTGLITARDLISSVSLSTESGAVHFRSRRQPIRDIRLESIHGEVTCELARDLNLRGWIRAGGKLSWNGEVEFEQGQLERQIGVGGPLLLASSQNSGVSVRLNLDQTTSKPLAASDPTTDPPARASRLPQRDASPAAGRDTPPAPSQTRPGTVGSRSSTQPASGEGTPGGYAVKVDVNWIHLNVSVRDRSSNRSVADLRKEDFLLYEDSQEQQIEQFSSTEAPFSVLLLLDISGSTEEFIDDVKDSAIHFIRGMRRDDRIAVAAFNSDVQMVHPFTSDRHRLERSIRRIREGGGTAFYDALEVCVGDYMYGEEGRKAIVVFTDGVDGQLIRQRRSGSRTPFRELYRDIQESESIIYTIFLDTRDRGGRGDREAYATAMEQMRMIADQTGGRFYDPRHVGELPLMFQEIADDLRVQYLLAYNSTNLEKDGAWRKIRVRIADRPDAVARTRQGYYAPQN